MEISVESSEEDAAVAAKVIIFDEQNGMENNTLSILLVYNVYLEKWPEKTERGLRKASNRLQVTP